MRTTIGWSLELGAVGLLKAGSASAALLARLPAGTRIEFWWNEEWGWCPATVRRTLEGAGGRLLHTLEFDGWEENWEDAALEFEDGGKRWRPLGPRRDEAPPRA